MRRFANRRRSHTVICLREGGRPSSRNEKLRFVIYSFSSDLMEGRKRLQLFCSSLPTVSSGHWLTDLFTSERQHTLEFFPRQPKKDRHLFKLRAPRVIRRRGEKTFDAGRKINAAHLLWRPVAGSATTIRILTDTKFT